MFHALMNNPVFMPMGMFYNSHNNDYLPPQN